MRFYLSEKDTREGLQVHSQIALAVHPLSSQTQRNKRAAHRAAVAHAATTRAPGRRPHAMLYRAVPRGLPAAPGTPVRPTDRGPVAPGPSSRSSADGSGAPKETTSATQPERHAFPARRRAPRRARAGGRGARGVQSRAHNARTPASPAPLCPRPPQP